MKITKNFKEKAKQAQKAGFKNMLISKTKNYGKYCYVRYSIDYLLALTDGFNLTNYGRCGSWETKNNPITKEDIFYQDLMR